MPQALCSCICLDDHDCTTIAMISRRNWLQFAYSTSIVFSEYIVQPPTDRHDDRTMYLLCSKTVTVA